MQYCLPRRRAQFVVKISKYCNLRCAYCYEYAELANKRRMSPDTMEKIFNNIAQYAIANNFGDVQFVWHGGEPFMIPLDYYESIGMLQRDIFGEKIEALNVVQTNLTILTDQHLQFLKAEKFFKSVGISFDVYGDQRVDTQGRLKTEAVLNNIQQLVDNDITFGGIAVLARNTLPHVSRIYKFYDKLGVPFRYLPFYLHAFEDQINLHAITYVELVSALQLIFDEWIASEKATLVEPIDDYIDFAIAYMSGRHDTYYHKEQDESVFVVDLDGGVWGQGESYEKDYRYGDLSQEALGDVLTSQTRRFAIEETDDRLNRHCENCQYFGACPGNYVADASPQQKAMLETSGCPVREVLDHIVETLNRTEIGDVISKHAASRQHNAALSANL
jgi:uncharacterized protein